jgi:plastocyanin
MMRITRISNLVGFLACLASSGRIVRLSFIPTSVCAKAAMAVPALVLAFALAPLASQHVRAETIASHTLTIENHRFSPSELKVRAGEAFRLVVRNLDATAEEFESHALKLEKIVPGGSEITLRVRPLDPGRYEFVGEFNEDTAKGVLIAE